MNVKSSLVVEEAEGIGISRRYLKPPDKMDPSANCQEDKQKGKKNFWKIFIAQVIPGLFVGNLADSKDISQLEQNHISHIVSVYDNARRIFKVRRTLYLKLWRESKAGVKELSPSR